MPFKSLEAQRAYRERLKQDPVRLAQQRKSNRESYARNKHKYDNVEYSLRQRYGLSWDQVYNMWVLQGESCAVCGISDPDRWCIDHDHDTNEVRGLLCDACNKGLGHFDDNPEILIAAAKYLTDCGKKAF